MVEPAQPKSAKGDNRSPYDNYRELMDDSLNKIIKTVNKSKYGELINLCKQALGKIYHSPKFQKNPNFVIKCVYRASKC